MKVREAVWRVLRKRAFQGDCVACIQSNELAILIRDEGYRLTTVQEFPDDLHDIATAAMLETIAFVKCGDDGPLNSLYSRLSAAEHSSSWDHLVRAFSTLSPLQLVIYYELAKDRSYEQIARTLSMSVEDVALEDLQSRHQVDHALRNGFAANQAAIG